MIGSGFKNIAVALGLFFIIFLLLSCGPKATIVGKWKEVGKAATLEFFANQTFEAVDNQGMAVSGKYNLLGDGHLPCKIKRNEGGLEVVTHMISAKGDELTLTSEGDDAIERYRRER